jgi:hypothetical protein
MDMHAVLNGQLALFLMHTNGRSDADGIDIAHGQHLLEGGVSGGDTKFSGGSFGAVKDGITNGRYPHPVLHIIHRQMGQQPTQANAARTHNP